MESSMGIEDFKRWHWVAIGIVLGTILTLLHLYSIDGERLTPQDTSGLKIGRSAFEVIQDLRTPRTDKGYSLINELTIYPVQEIVVRGATQRTQYLTGVFFERQPSGQYKAKPFHVTTDVPFKPPGVRTPPPNEHYTFGDFVEQLKKDNPALGIKYSYAWWTLPPAVAAIWGGGTVLLVGGVWPFVVSLMIGAGFGRPKKAEAEYDLDRFGKSGADDDKLGRPTTKAVSQEEHDKLQKLQETLERNLAASGVTETSPADAATAQPAPLRKLDGGPLEVTVGAGQAEEEGKEFKGEFYPVAHAVVHKHDKEPDAAKKQ